MKHTALLMRLLVLLILMSTLGGCASVLTGSHESLAIETISHDGKEIVGANCDLVNSKGTQSITTPSSVDVSRAHGDLTINCTKDGQPLGTATTKSSLNGTVFGNIFLGGAIGAGIDVGSGAAFDYPDRITVRMGSAVTVQKAPNTSGKPKPIPGPKPRPQGPMVFGAWWRNLDNWESRRSQTHHGILIGLVYQDTPAEAANIQRGDIVRNINDIEVFDSPHFTRLLRMLSGQHVQLTIQRGDTTVTQDVALNRLKS